MNEREVVEAIRRARALLEEAERELLADAAYLRTELGLLLSDIDILLLKVEKESVLLRDRSALTEIIDDCPG